mgnify:CR=1 FL=1
MDLAVNTLVVLSGVVGPVVNREEEWPSIGGEELKEEVVSEEKEVEVINRKSLNVNCL